MAAAVLSSALSLIQDLVTRPRSQSPSKDAVAIHHDLDKLNGSMLQIQHLAADMAKEEEENGKDETVRHWLRQLRGAAYDAEDLIDECRFQLLARSNTDNGAQMPPEEVHDPTHPPSQHGIAVRIRSLRERLDEIAKQRETLHWESCWELDAEAELPPPLLFNVDDSVVCGRDDDKREVIELLLANHRRDLSVIPIVGPGGVGKTALARLVYDDATIRDHFDARGWVYLSEDFDLIRLISAIVVSVTNMKHIYVEQDHGKPLKCQILRGKRFLLVLDNVQNENQTLWNSLRALLSVGLEGSAIVATTRSESVAKFMQTVLSYNLIPLPQKQGIYRCVLKNLGHSFAPLSMPNDLFVGLKFLRTLDLSETPESLCGLYNLQTLDLRDSEKLEELPKSITNVTNLRHLYLPRYVSIIPMPQGIGKLTNLQTLSTFYVDHGEQNCAIMELKDLVNLRGKFEIAGLHNVASVDYVEDALKDLRHIAKLILSSGINYDYGNLGESDFSLFDRVVEDNQSLSNVHDELQTSTEDVVQVSVPKEICNGLETTVFDRLRPHTNLMELVVRSYHSLQFPNWMGDASFSNLASVELEFCSKCEVLPPLGQLPLLRHLAFNELSGLENIGQEFCGHDAMIRIKGFPSLETLQFRSMYRWQEWSYVEDGSFPRLRHLELNYCPKLRRLPHILPSLVNLVIWHCPELMALPMLPSLTRLEGCCNEMIWSSMPQDLISRLQDLSICESEDLASLPLENLHAIREFNISSCQQNTSHVAFLELHLLNLVFLKRFKIRRCPGIWFSPNHKLPPALQVLEILNCPLLEEWCHGHGSNELVHISRVIVDQKDFHLAA